MRTGKYRAGARCRYLDINFRLKIAKDRNKFAPWNRTCIQKKSYRTFLSKSFSNYTGTGNFSTKINSIKYLFRIFLFLKYFVARFLSENVFLKIQVSKNVPLLWTNPCFYPCFTVLCTVYSTGNLYMNRNNKNDHPKQTNKLDNIEPRDNIPGKTYFWTDGNPLSYEYRYR
jgi:hypothetical protein